MVLENGYYKLSGVDSYFDGDSIKIVLDGIVYEFEEDPDDGYRSYMEGPKIVKKEVKNTFPEVKVKLVVNENYYFDGITLYDCATKKEVLVVGTDYSDDYYPIAIYSWYPENLVINQ